MGWFEGKSKKEKKSALKNVIAVMLADGIIDAAERRFLTAVCKRLNLSENEAHKILNDQKGVKFVVPKAKEERVRQLVDSIFMMMADGKIEPREMDTCMCIAARFGFSPSIVPRVVADIVNAIRGGRSRAQIIIVAKKLF
jgi:uncharacterized membrane protein YebE (DUF533 family)